MTLPQLKSNLLSSVAAQRAKLGGILNERHVLMACVAIESNPKVLQCSQESIWGCVVRAANYEWVCDPAMGQCAIVPFKGVATLIPEYKGWIDLIGRAGSDVVMDCVHQGDTIEWRGMFAEPIHKKSRNPQRRFLPFTDAYVVVRHRATGAVRTESWSVGECIAHRDRYSKNWQFDQSEKNPWHERSPAFRVMCMKTVLLEMVHRGMVQVSLKDRQIVRDAIDYEGVGSITVKPTNPTPEAPAALPGPEADQTIEAEHAAPSQETPSEEAELESREIENQFRDLVMQQRLQSEMDGLLKEIDAHAALLPDARQRLHGLARDHLATQKGKRGERSNARQKSLPE
jgi:phage RecT family recombinase